MALGTSETIGITLRESREGVSDEPIGSVTAWLKSFTNTPDLPSEWIECNGQVLNDAASPLNGQTIPNLNGDNRFLYGKTTSGGVGGSDTHTHTIPTFTSQQFNGEPDADWYSNMAANTNAGSSLPPYYSVVWIMRIK